MAGFVDVTAVIPTWRNGRDPSRTLEVLKRLDPRPLETILFCDGFRRDAPNGVKVYDSSERIGPGGGRGRMIRAASQPFVLSVDDDSWPVDSDCLARVVGVLEQNPSCGLVAGVVTHRGEPVAAREDRLEETAFFSGCGHVIRREAYLACTGYVTRPWAYGIEEVDLGLQLHAKGWRILRDHSFRIFHDTELRHHESSEIASSTVENFALRGFLRYPLVQWWRCAWDMVKISGFLIRRGRLRGLADGLRATPSVLWRHRHMRSPVSSESVRSYWKLRHGKG